MPHPVPQASALSHPPKHLVALDIAPHHRTEPHDAWTAQRSNQPIFYMVVAIWLAMSTLTAVACLIVGPALRMF